LGGSKIKMEGLQKARSFFAEQLEKVPSLVSDEKLGYFRNTLTVLGALRVLGFTSWMLKGFYEHSLRKSHDLPSRYGANTWAVVTGASDGIGKGFCQQLAAQGFNVCLVARNQAKLHAVAEEIEKTYKVQTKVVVLDFSNCTKYSHYENAFNQMKDLEVSILINNVGVSKGAPFFTWQYQTLQDFLTINVHSQVMFSRFFTTKLLEREGRSAIINVSSLSSYLPVGNCFAIYTATKLFNHSLSLSLAEELRGKIDVMSVTPGGVKTNLSNQYDYPGKEKAPGPDKLVKAVFRDLGHQDSTSGLFEFKFLKNFCFFLSQFEFGRQFVIKKNRELYESTL